VVTDATPTLLVTPTHVAGTSGGGVLKLGPTLHPPTSRRKKESRRTQGKLLGERDRPGRPVWRPARQSSLNWAWLVASHRLAERVFGETPKTAVGTTALPEITAGHARVLPEIKWFITATVIRSGGPRWGPDARLSRPGKIQKQFPPSLKPQRPPQWRQGRSPSANV